MAQVPHRASIECSRLAAERATALLHLEFGRGQATLRAIASCAPLLGLLGMVIPLIEGLRQWHVPGPLECVSGGIVRSSVSDGNRHRGCCGR